MLIDSTDTRSEDKPAPRGIAILGSTGSIGTQTLDVLGHLAPQFRVVALAASTNTSLLAEQAASYTPDLVVCDINASAPPELPAGARLMHGSEGLIAAATHPDAEIVVVASTGHAAIEATIEAIKLGKTIALANKETLVCAASLILPLAQTHGAPIHPIDSEHSAIWQSLDRGHSQVSRLILTASGGPFLHTPLDAIANATIADALGHPTWSMGAKITIDSATMMNKGLELIEAHYLFSMPYDHIDVVIHPESIIHSIVEYPDGSQIAQASLPDMRLPIQFALTYPHHVAGPCQKLDLAAVGQLNFLPVEPDRFPALDVAREAGSAGKSFPAVLSAADEAAVVAFLDERIGFGDIIPLVKSALDAHDPVEVDSMDVITSVDAWARAHVERAITRRSG